jgi:inner membrane protein
MPLTTTHALVPLAGAVAFASSPVQWRPVFWAAVAAAAPDLDGLTNPVWADRWGLSTYSVYAHRGAAHSLFVALAFGLVAAIFHKRLGVRPLTAAVVVGGTMATHGLLDMLTDSGRPVAYLWPLSSARVFADWRPLHSSPVAWHHFGSQLFARQRAEFQQIIIPMLGLALATRLGRMAWARFRKQFVADSPAKAACRTDVEATPDVNEKWRRR